MLQPIRQKVLLGNQQGAVPLFFRCAAGNLYTDWLYYVTVYCTQDG